MNQHSFLKPRLQSKERLHLIRMQRQIFRDLEREVRERVGRPPKSLERALQSYERSFKTIRKIASMHEILEEILLSPIVLLGDYHTLRQSQKSCLKILQGVVGRGRKVILAMELIYRKDQPILDRYLQGEIDEKSFLNAIRYHTTFPFNWVNYQPIFEFAKQRRIPAFGINFTARLAEDSLKERDQRGAKEIVKLIEENPGAILLVLYGDLHLRKEGIPGFVQEELQKKDLDKRLLVLYQNNESVYWKLAKRGIENKTEAVQLSTNAYCLMNSAPWIKLQSYLLWLEYGEDLLCKYYNECDPEEHSHSAFDYSHEIAQFAQRITEFLKLPSVNLESFEVHTMDDLRFLNRYALLRKWEIRRWILHSKSCYLPEKKIIYLARLDVNYAAEEAAEFIHHATSDYPIQDYLEPPYFFHRAWRKALGFFGSKLINPKRKVPSIAKGNPLYGIVHHYQHLLNQNQKIQEWIMQVTS
jgi:uncharacterized iron-regulated protein